MPDLTMQNHVVHG